ncbi:SLAIN motif-containing protein 1 [Merluccius polli]|uniref:SLAIN motif-containing protein 1 n=1 Tax=Merluccius polli TaxID=89951 RepID=A0AA47P309_MERPO|nr:SLAIN motif-containing protein 1 [Merluccius polli]
MEAEVGLLHRQVMAEVEVVDHNCNSLSAELEVRKLQALVRSLERQNRQLRSRRGRAVAPEDDDDNNNNNTTTAVSEDFHADFFSDDEGGGGEEESTTTVLDDVEELDLDDLLSCGDSDDETWLYVSSRAGMCVDTPPLSPLQWCRQVLDSPRSEEAQRTPSLHLRRVSRWRPSVSSLSPSSPFLGRVAGASPIGASPTLAGKSCSTPLFSQCPASPLASPLLLSLRRSLSPLLKEPLPPAERSPTFLPHLASRGRRSGLSPERSDDDERDAITMGYKLNDLTDVQVMARLQEESKSQTIIEGVSPGGSLRPHLGLRQDYASMAPRQERRRSLSLRPRLRTEEEEEVEEEEVYGLLSPPPLRLSILPRPHTFSSAREWRQSSGSLYTPPDTPPTSPVPTYATGPFSPPLPAWPVPVGHSAAQPQGLRPGSDKLRRSMPNLVRAPSMPSVTTSANQRAPLSLLRNSLSFDSSAQFHSSVHLQNRVHSVGCFSSSPGQPLKATAYVSPTIKGSVAMPTGIPLLSCKTPATSRSSLPRPAASSAPRTRIAESAHRKKLCSIPLAENVADAYPSCPLDAFVNASH